MADTFNQIVLQVNDEIATLLDYKERYMASELELRRQFANNPAELQRGMERLAASVLGAMYHEMLILSRADQMGERASSSDVEKEIDRRRQLLQIATDEEFRERLARSGLTIEALRESIRQEILIQMVMQREVSERIDLEEDDLRRIWRDNPQDFLIPEQRKLREVVVLEDGGLSAEQMEQVALQLRERLAKETEAAAILSDYQERKIASGVIDLGWVPKGDLDPALEAAVDALKPGQASPPVVGRGGLHVLHLLERQAEAVLPFDEVKQRIFAQERGRLYERELPRYLMELEKKSFVVARPPAGAESFREQPDPGDEIDPLAAFSRSGAAGATPPPAAAESAKEPSGTDGR